MKSKKTGRKTRLEIQPELTQQLCDYIRQGTTVRTAVQAVGLAESSFHQYVRRGDPSHPNHAPQFAQFSAAISRARGEGKARLVEIVSKAALHDWRAAVELLRMISPNEYGRVYRDQITDAEPTTQDGGGGGAPQIESSTITWDVPVGDILSAAEREYLKG